MATVDAALRGVRPGVSMRVSVDSEYGELLGPTSGLYLQVPLR